jgi:2-polyprenyl-3-methyl-5-hydroxy-6-metoxy-1,4-benzoquinol methylase
MSEVPRRPFYTEYAWAFDLLIDRPVRKECAVIAAWLVDRGVLPGSEILDAGCGTGRYAIELARRGYVVHGIDLSPDLIEVAMSANREVHRRVSFAVGNIAHLSPSRYAAILCRGVLNDIVDDAGRDAILLTRHHFGELSCVGAYDPDVAASATDRLVAVAQRVDAA